MFAWFLDLSSTCTAIYILLFAVPLAGASRPWQIFFFFLRWGAKCKNPLVEQQPYLFETSNKLQLKEHI